MCDVQTGTQMYILAQTLAHRVGAANREVLAGPSRWNVGSTEHGFMSSILSGPDPPIVDTVYCPDSQTCKRKSYDALGKLRKLRSAGGSSIVQLSHHYDISTHHPVLEYNTHKTQDDARACAATTAERTSSGANGIFLFQGRRRRR